MSQYVHVTPNLPGFRTEVERDATPEIARRLIWAVEFLGSICTLARIDSIDVHSSFFHRYGIDVEVGGGETKVWLWRRTS